MDRWRRGGATVAVAAALVAAAGCNGSGAAGGGSGRLQVVAAENFWGSIAQQLGGDRVRVTSIISNPATDPHSYEPTAADARTMASSQMAIVNGVGYDTWASQLLAASPAGGRVVLNVGSLVGAATGANPHRWYFPANVFEVAGQITRDYQRLDPAHRAYYAARKHRFEAVGLAEYNRLRRRIRARYAGVPVGYSESIFQGLGQNLGLRLLTPYSFAKAIAEGTEPTPQDVATIDRQITGHEIKIWITNSQNSTPDVARLTALARSHDIPTTTITETLSPAGASFERWQVSELRSLAAALAKAARR